MGYPLAFIPVKLGHDIPFNEIKNLVTEVTSACFEPSLDYLAIKIRSWDLKESSRVLQLLSSGVKSLGEASRLLQILFSESAYLIWSLRCERVIGGRTHSPPRIQSQMAPLN